MIYPDSFEVKTGFDQVRLRLQNHCLGPAGKALAENTRISTKAGVVETWQAQTAEAFKLLSEGKDFLSGYYTDLTSVFRKLDIEGAYLLESEWQEVLRLLNNLLVLYRFSCGVQAQQLIYLPPIYTGVEDPTALIQRVRQVFDENGQVKDAASSELQRLRRMILEEQRALRRRLESMLKQSQRDGFSPDGSEITIRAGRLVIPVAAEHKRRIKGFIHDESATGQTVFLEPGDVLEGNNRVRELEYEERREIMRILQQLTDVARTQKGSLAEGYKKVGLLDFIRAKARMAQETDAYPPIISREGRLRWRSARNPVLESLLAGTGRKLVPLDLELDRENRILVISGPNAGGKSVSLKTAGLLQYMVQFGLHIPAGEGAVCPVFERFFIDIGDDQSMENDLSTYSSHLKHMQFFMAHANAGSLFLIDEFGTGTDPAYGGAIAASVLEELVERGSMGIVTTHFSSLKEMADQTPGLRNASMRFDLEGLAPLYQLQLGQPGSSFALEIAAKNGLPKKVLAKAKALVGQDRIRADELLSGLEKERLHVDRLRARLAEQTILQEKLQTEYEGIKQYLEANRKTILNQAREEAKTLLQEANRKIEETIRTIRESQADRDLTKLARIELENFNGENLQNEILPEGADKLLHKKQSAIKKTKALPPAPEKLSGPIATGDYVVMKGGESMGTVLEIKGKTARVQMGAFVTQVKVDQLERMAAPKKEKDSFEKVGPTVRGLDVNRKMQDFSTQLDVRGLYPSEALNQLEVYMDDALILGLKQIRIVHGKGNGVLKNQVRQALKGYHQIAQMAYDHPDRGGEGVTIVDFK